MSKAKLFNEGPVTIRQVQGLVRKFGRQATLENVLAALMAERPHRCPRCDGRGYVTEEYDAYPRGLPDSGWATDMRTRNVVCHLCGGEGYTAEEYIPNMVQDGWKKKGE